MAEMDPTLKFELGLVERVEMPNTFAAPADVSSHLGVMPAISGATNLRPKRDGKGQFRARSPVVQRKWLPKKKREWAFYPQVWISLGCKAVPKKPKKATVSFFKKQKRPNLLSPNANLQGQIDKADDIQLTIKGLAEELVTLQSKELGAYYPGVWKVLRFKKPSKKSYRVMRPDEDTDDDMDPVGAKRLEAPSEFVPQPPPFAYGAPVIIDVSVLASEVDGGRYPSVQRNNSNIVDSTNGLVEHEVEHDDNCYICKDSRGVLYLCDFCHRVNRLVQSTKLIVIIVYNVLLCLVKT